MIIATLWNRQAQRSAAVSRHGREHAEAQKLPACSIVQMLPQIYGSLTCGTAAATPPWRPSRRPRRGSYLRRPRRNSSPPCRSPPFQDCIDLPDASCHSCRSTGMSSPGHRRMISYTESSPLYACRYDQKFLPDFSIIQL